MTRKIIQIKGTHGSGKSTIVKQLIALSSDVEILRNDRGKEYATVMHDLKWVVLGRDGQCDNLDSATRKLDSIKSLIISLSNTYEDYWLVFEGAIIGNLMSLYEFIRVTYDGAIKVVILQSTVENCIRRIEYRRGLPLESTKKTEDKAREVNSHIARLDMKYVEFMQVDLIEECNMVYEFLAAVGWEYPYGQTD